MTIENQENENITATNPFSSEDEELNQHNFNDMNEEDVKQFVENIAHPEISIKGKNALKIPNKIKTNSNETTQTNYKMGGIIKENLSQQKL